MDTYGTTFDAELTAASSKVAEKSAGYII